MPRCVLGGSRFASQKWLVGCWDATCAEQRAAMVAAVHMQRTTHRVLTPCPTLPSVMQVDIVIVGAGSAGLAAAYELSKHPDVKVRSAACIECPSGGS